MDQFGLSKPVSIVCWFFKIHQGLEILSWNFKCTDSNTTGNACHPHQNCPPTTHLYTNFDLQRFPQWMVVNHLQTSIYRVVLIPIFRRAHGFFSCKLASVSKQQTAVSASSGATRWNFERYFPWRIHGTIGIFCLLIDPIKINHSCR